MSSSDMMVGLTVDSAHPGRRTGKLKCPGVTGRTPAGRKENKQTSPLSLSTQQDGISAPTGERGGRTALNTELGLRTISGGDWSWTAQVEGIKS